MSVPESRPPRGRSALSDIHTGFGAGIRLILTGVLFRSTSGSLPVGARSAVVILTLTRLEGTANDGYADSLSLALIGI